MYYRRLKICIIYLALNRGCFETSRNCAVSHCASHRCGHALRSSPLCSPRVWPRTEKFPTAMEKSCSYVESVTLGLEMPLNRFFTAGAGVHRRFPCLGYGVGGSWLHVRQRGPSDIVLGVFLSRVKATGRGQGPCPYSGGREHEGRIRLTMPAWGDVFVLRLPGYEHRGIGGPVQP
jgi:hypothetical protein